MRDFSFNGVSLSSFGGRIIEAPRHTIATRDKTFTKIYGQSGDELIDNGSYNNVTFSVEIGFFTFVSQQTAQQLASAIINWLAPLQDGYYVYRDSENTGYFTRAALVNFDQVEQEMRTFLKAMLTFNRVPFWYSDSGQTSVTFYNGGASNTLNNPEIYDSEPIYKFNQWRPYTDKVNISVNSTAVSFTTSAHPTTYYIDNVAKQFYKISAGSKNYLGIIQLPNLRPGSNTISFDLNDGSLSAGSFNLEIIPNWRRL